MPRRPNLKDGHEPISDPVAVQRVLDLLCTGMSIKEACEQPGTPSPDSIYRKLGKDPEFEAALQPYRVAQQHALMDRCVELAFSATPETTQLNRLRVDTILKTAARMAPKQFGDKQQIDVNVTHGLADRLTAAIQRQTGVVIDVLPEMITSQ